MVVGVVPAAGHATRLQLRAGSKEVLVVRGRPVMDHLVERMREGGAEQVRVVTRPEKHDVVAHATALGAAVIEGHPPDVAASMRLGLDGLDDADDVLLGFPDSLWEPRDGFTRLLVALRAGARAALGLFPTPDLSRSDVVEVGPDGRILGIEVKPERPRGTLIWGIAAAQAGTWRRELEEGTEIGVSLGRLAAAAPVAGVALPGPWIDIGTPEALKAVTHEK